MSFRSSSTLSLKSKSEFCSHKMTSSLKRFKLVSLSPTVILLWCTKVFPFNVLKVSFPPFYSRRKENQESMTAHVDMNLLMLSRRRLLFNFRLGLLISKITITMSIYGNVREEVGVSGWVILMTHISYNDDLSWRELLFMLISCYNESCCICALYLQRFVETLWLKHQRDFTNQTVTSQGMFDIPCQHPPVCKVLLWHHPGVWNQM